MSLASGVEVERVFIGAGCNRVVNNVSWGACGLVAFGTQNAVALFSPLRGEIVTTLPGHKAAVNCTLWLPTKKDVLQVRGRETHYLLSGSADGAIMAWKIGSSKGEWTHALQLPGMHKRGVTCFAGRMVSDTVSIFASTSSDGIVVIWEMAVDPNNGGSCKVSCLHSLSVGSKPMVSLSLAVLLEQESHLILAMGGLDHKIHIYYGDKSGKFIKACELKGHSDWIRSLDFSLPVMMSSEKHNLFLVSSSQDRTIRIWKMTSEAIASGSTVQLRKGNIEMASYIEGPLFVAGNTSYQVSLESLLVGHEDWVYSVEWQPPTLLPGDEAHQPMSVLSASMDKMMMMIWQPEKNTGLWINSVTVGELSHSALGFYGGHWQPNGKSIPAHGYGGSFHMWRDVGLGSDNWQPQIVPSGHFCYN
uniref:Elongator complex protein 2 n=1 Tax=Arundo donax TaxID=35708 RepID=A0A0A9D3X7_ARUDO